MSRELVIKTEAREDIIDAFLWHEDQLEGLGQEFLLELESGFDHLLARPFAFQTVYRDYRHLPLDRFPYVVIFTADDESLVVYRVFHTSRSPEHWQGVAGVD
jgi:toxin ParE1/3/4